MNQEIETNRISACEIHVVDPKTKGIWKVVAKHILSDAGALIAIHQTITDEGIRPAEGVTITVNYQIKVQEGEEECHPLFDDILLALSQAEDQFRNRK